MKKYQEIEFKYNASGTSLSKFEEFCKKLNPDKFFTASGFDYFYANADSPESFYRLRVGADFNQLTFKRKTKDENNYIRTEHNIDLKNHVTKDQIEALCADFNYKYNMSIFKNAFVYTYDWYTLVYYVVYDENMKELGRFIEIELSEEKEWASDESAWNELVVIEKLCKDIGITAQSRIKKSLYEMFKKESK